MHTDTNETPLHELESAEIALEQLEAVSGGSPISLAEMAHEVLKNFAGSEDNPVGQGRLQNP